MTDLSTLAVPGDVRVPAAPSPRTDLRLRVLALGSLVLVLLAVTVALTWVVTMPPGRTAQLNSSFAVILQMVGMAGLALAGAVLARQQPRARSPG